MLVLRLERVRGNSNPEYGIGYGIGSPVGAIGGPMISTPKS